MLDFLCRQLLCEARHIMVGQPDRIHEPLNCAVAFEAHHHRKCLTYDVVRKQPIQNTLCSLAQIK